MNARSCIAAAIPAVALLGPSCECVAGLDGDVRLGVEAITSAASGSTGGGSGGDGASSASGGGDVGVGGDGAADCRPMDVPGYPGTEDAGGDVEVVVALRSVTLNDEGEAVGLNLDAVCTCPDPTSCIPDGSTDDDLLCDGAGGVDAQSARIFGQLALLTNDQFSSRELSQAADAGSWSVLLRVEGWTGEPTDSRVRFSMFPSPGLVGEGAPAWTGEDAWVVDATSVAPGGASDQPVYADDNAYVADGVLVASLPQSAIALVSSDARLDLKLVAGFLKGQLVEEGGRWALRDAVLAARLRTADLFQALDGFRDGDGEPICTTSSLFDLARETICESADIFSGTGTPTSPCDAISVGIGFSAEPARLGEVVEASEVPPGCEPGTEPSQCTCDGGC